MKISVINKESEHLTATNKKHIVAILSQNLTEGRVNKIDYKLIKTSADTYLVAITQNITNWCEIKPRITTYYASFKVLN